MFEARKSLPSNRFFPLLWRVAKASWGAGCIAPHDQVVVATSGVARSMPKKPLDVEAVLRYATIRRVKEAMRPYLEAIL